MTNRIAVVVSHPIQHFCPQYSSWSKLDGVDLKVFFASRHGLDPYVDKQFGRAVKWEGLQMEFPHEFLPGAAERAVSGKVDSEALEGLLTAFSPDVVVVYGYMQPLQRRAMRWSKSNARRLLMIADSELRASRSRLKKFAKQILLPRILKGVDGFLTVGDANEQYYRAYGVDDRKLIRCSFPIDTVAFDAVHDRRDIVRHERRAMLGIPEDHVVLLMVGKLVPWKRQLDLVELANRARPGRAMTVVLAGTGLDDSMLRTLARIRGVGGVFFAGFVTPSDLVSYYAAADIYVHCSEVEPHSLVISEAIYAGLPVVVSDRCGSYGPSDDVRVGLNGFVYECGNVSALEGCISMLIADSMLMKSMREHSRLIARSNQNLAHGEALQQALNMIRAGS